MPSIKSAIIALRLEPKAAAALARIAARDERTVSAVAREVLTEWLKQLEPASSGKRS